MSIDLEELFRHAGSNAPAPGIDTDLVVRRGRRLRARRRAVAATTSLVALGVVAAGSVMAAGALQPRGAGPAGFATSGPTATVTSATEEPTQPTPSASAQPVAAPTREGLRLVSLPDPAPGFPVRRAPDSVERMSVGPVPGESWVKTFLLASGPAAEVTDAAGNVSGTPTGPEATVFVGGMPEVSPGVDGTIAGRPVVATPTVAGVRGYVTDGSEKGKPISTLYFTRGRLSVEVIGFGGVKVGQLVAVGDALTGLV